MMNKNIPINTGVTYCNSTPSSRYTAFAIGERKRLGDNKSNSIKVPLRPRVRRKTLIDLLNNCFDKNFHLIVCRNVVIYFTDEAKEKLYKDFYNSLCSKGILFVGSTEIIKNHNKTGFNLISSFFYQK